MTASPAPANRLIHETSPYLQQHAHNPVDWYPWGEEAIQNAKREDRPIFLSIGYSACHWCHVMEHESFEDPAIGAYLNEHFVSIKVDREERPDVDQIYMAAVQLLTRSGGWPMSMFLTPDLQPFYGGTYYPPDQRYGRPSFRQVLEAVQDAWKNRRDTLLAQAADLTQHVQLFGALEPAEGQLHADLLQKAANHLGHVFDATHGGFGSAPKFPHAMELRLLLRVWKRFGDDNALAMARKTLDSMAMGGIYDHLGGGFHRYSTDRQWLAPHFEKMLYDNALLTLAYLDGYQATGDSFYKTVVDDTLAYIQREMLSPEGPFFSTQDADSEGEEGKFFVWTRREVEKVLGSDLAEIFCRVYDVSEAGNWEGHNILHLSRTPEQNAKILYMDVGSLEARLKEARQKLRQVRDQRIWPGRDEKVLTSWNALMIDAFAQAAQVLSMPTYAAIASRAAEFLWTTMRRPDRRLYRTYSAAKGPKLNAYLEDYSFFMNALVTLYEATFDARWIQRALELEAVMVEEFWDNKDGGFFYTGKSHEQLIARGKDPHDSSIPSGNSMAVTALLRLAKLTGRKDLLSGAEATLRLFTGLLTSSPQAAGQMLLALDFYLGPVDEFAIVGDPAADETRRVRRRIQTIYHPRKVVAFKPAGQDSADLEKLLPLLEGKTTAENVTTYICRNFTCGQPCVGEQALQERLSSLEKTQE